MCVLYGQVQWKLLGPDLGAKGMVFPWYRQCISYGAFGWSWFLLYWSFSNALIGYSNAWEKTGDLNSWEICERILSLSGTQAKGFSAVFAVCIDFLPPT